jgi:hypothetical protein
MALVSVVAGCGDRCERLCVDVTERVDACSDAPPWGALGAESRRDFQRGCGNEWNREARALSPQELEQALDACEAAAVNLDALDCAEVREAWGLP